MVQRAYAPVAYSDHREHLMVDCLRGTDAYIAALSLVAETAHGAVGHILLTRAWIGTSPSAATTLALAPLSVVPEVQSRGIGTRLVRAAHDRAVALGFGSVLVIGSAAYYRRFGYASLSRYPIVLPFAAPEADCLIRELRPGALAGVSGRVAYAEGWLDH